MARRVGCFALLFVQELHRYRYRYRYEWEGMTQLVVENFVWQSSACS